MTMFIAYTRMTAAELEADIPVAIESITNWFEENPDRDTCESELWMGKRISVGRDTIEKDVRGLAATIETKPDGPYSYETVREPKLSIYKVSGPNNFSVSMQSPEDGRMLVDHLNKISEKLSD